MKKRLSNLLLFFVLIMTAASCSKEVLNEDGQGVEPNSTLIIRTQAGSENITTTTEALKVSYPINVYAFNSSGKCADMMQITDNSSTSISMKLVEGTYDICAVAGADAENYTLPTRENATLESIVPLNTEAAHGDLMTAKNTVTLTEGGENTLTLSLARKVMLLQEVAVKNVPSTIESVSVTIAPLYENLCVNGAYNGDKGSLTIQLAKEGDAGTWKNTTEIYLLEASAGNATVTVGMTDNSNKTKSYSYTSTEELKANYKIKISGTYINDVGVTLTGTIVGAKWAGEKDIIFDINENGGSEEPGDGTTPPVVETTAPAVGTLYKDKYYVLKSESNGNTTTVTLMTTEEKTALTFNDNEESIKAAVESTIAAMTDGTDGVTGWRLPNKNEADFIKGNVREINNNLYEIKTSYTRLAGTNVIFYFFTNADNAISSYCFGDGRTHAVDTDTRLRAFTTITFQ